MLILIVICCGFCIAASSAKPIFTSTYTTAANFYQHSASIPHILYQLLTALPPQPPQPPLAIPQIPQFPDYSQIFGPTMGEIIGSITALFSLFQTPQSPEGGPSTMGTIW